MSVKKKASLTQNDEPLHDDVDVDIDIEHTFVADCTKRQVLLGGQLWASGQILTEDRPNCSL
jgi:hypothetical protein